MMQHLYMQYMFEQLIKVNDWIVAKYQFEDHERKVKDYVYFYTHNYTITSTKPHLTLLSSASQANTEIGPARPQLAFTFLTP